MRRMPRRPRTTFLLPRATTEGRPVTSSQHAGVTDTRIAAAAICADLRAGALLDGSFDRRSAALEARDRRWTRELVYGMLRHRSWIDTVLADRVRGGPSRLDADAADLLRLGTHQLLFMGSVPAYEAIAQTVLLVNRRHAIGASKLGNSV